ncbi:MAG: recombinase family protein [Pirellulales bacterium]|nr:recombinase family protein [Pirellulales bacterium]
MSIFIVAYYRVSTEDQGKSGLGLEAQQKAVRDYAARIGAKIIAEYKEVESGACDDRSELSKAIAHAKRSKATLVIAKLDRLARDMHFVSGLMKKGVDFVCCEFPNADSDQIYIWTMFAERELKRISERTKAALKAYKDGKHVSKKIREKYPNGVPEDIVRATAGKLGAARPGAYRFSIDDAYKGGEVAREVIAKMTREAYSDIAPKMLAWRKAGCTLQEIADLLNNRGHTTRQSKPWNHVQVMRVLRLFAQIT